MTHGRTRIIVHAFAIAAIACLAVTVTPQATSAEESTGPVTISITGLSPVALGRNSSLSISGAIANTGLTTITALDVRLVMSTGPITERRGLRTASTNEDAYFTIPIYATGTTVADSLAPGAIVDFRIVVDADDLALGSPGVYLIGVEATGYGPNGYAVLDTERTLIPYMPGPVTPVNVVWLWPLATSPSQAPDDILLGDAIPRDLAPDGRLNQLLEAGESSPSITWVVDPQLLQVAADMSDGYLVDRAGRIRAGTRSQAAAAWLERARELLGTPRRSQAQARTSPLWVIPYADPDANALEKGRLTTDLVRSTTSAPVLADEQLGRRPDGTLAWATHSRPSQSALDVLASAGATAVVVRGQAAPAPSDLGYTPSGYVDIPVSGGQLRALVIDPALLAALDMPQSGQSGLLAARQRFMSELAFVALEPSPRPRYLVAGPTSPRWDPNPRLLRAIIASLRASPWAKLVPVDTIMALPSTESERVFRTRTSGGSEFQPDYLDRLRRTQDGIESLRTVLTDPVAVTGPLTAALARAESNAWRTRPREGNRLLDAIDASLTSTASTVYVVPRGDIVLSGDSGNVPVTVSNDLDQPVRVGLTITADPAARLAAQALPAVQIEPGRRASLEVPVRIIGGDALTVAVQLTDPAGVPFGEPVALELRTTAYSRAALWVAIAAAVALALLVVFDIVRRARQRSAHRRGSPA